MTASPRRNALGRGLDSLISMDDAPARGTSVITEVRLDRISPNPDQPRRTFDEEALAELAASIREIGIIQPLSLRKTGPDSYQIIAGERRFRASQLAGLVTVPAYIRTATDMEMTQMALIENIQREDLNPVEIALTYRKLMDQSGLTQERLAESVGKKRTTIANFLRLLKLPAEVQLGLRDRRVDVGHARALIALDNPKQQLRLYNEIITKGLNVRQVEEAVKRMRDGGDSPAGRAPAPAPAAARELRNMSANLTGRFGVPVNLKCRANGAGSITFAFRDSDQMARLLALLDTVNPQ